MWETVKQWDRDLFVFLNGIGIEKYDGFWIFITQSPNWIPLYVLFVFLFFKYYKRQNGLIVSLYLLLTLLVTLALTSVVKEYVARLRPSEVKEWAELIRVLQKPSRYSFFSGHSASSFAVTTFTVLSLRKYTRWIFLGFLWPILFALSRIYVGVHYPSDIFVGMVVGISLGYLGYRVSKLSLRSRELNLP